MKIESKIRRKSGTKVLMDGIEYHFKPEKEGGPHIAVVTDQAHIARFLSITEGYCVADGDPALKAENDEGPALGVDDPIRVADTAGDDGKKAPAKTGTPRKRGRKSAAQKAAAAGGDS